MSLQDGNEQSSSTSSASKSTQNTIFSNLLASATASIVSRLATHPLDTAKARLQYVSKKRFASPYRGTFDAIMKTYSKEGIKALYRGFGIILVGGTPGTMLYLCSYDVFKDRTSSVFNDHSSFVAHFFGGMFAETVACIIYVPVDVIKERLQVQSLMQRKSLLYKGSYDAVQQIMKAEGVPGLYKAYIPTLLSFGPYSAFYFMFYEQIKTQIVSYDLSKSRHDLSFNQLVCASAGAGALASWLTSPLDLAKFRLQIQRAGVYGDANQPIFYSGMIDCLKKAYLADGLRGLFRGSVARVIHFVPSITITMTCYEKLCPIFANNFKALR